MPQKWSRPPTNLNKHWWLMLESTSEKDTKNIVWVRSLVLSRHHRPAKLKQLLYHMKMLKVTLQSIDTIKSKINKVSCNAMDNIYRYTLFATTWCGVGSMENSRAPYNPRTKPFSICTGGAIAIPRWRIGNPSPKNYIIYIRQIMSLRDIYLSWTSLIQASLQRCG